MRRFVCATLLACVLAPLLAAAPPIAQLRGDALRVTLPADFLANRDVRKQLDSGLTTTFAVVVTLGGAEGRSSGARIDIRFEPWDEVYFVTTRRIGAAAQTQKLASFAHLQAWWRETPLPLFTQAAGTRSVQVAIDVLPFSVEEQQETQRWLSRSLGEARQPATATAGPGETAPSVHADSGVLDLLIGTSIKRQPIVRRRWQVQVTP